MNPRSSYREAAVRGASPVGLVVLLYEQILDDLRQALAALRKGDVEGRTRKINHAILVIGHLQGGLDLERGQEVARNLEHFYNLVRSGLVVAQCKQSAKALEAEIARVDMLHEAWIEVERTVPEPVDNSPSPVQKSAGDSLPVASPNSPAEWRA